MSASKSTVSTLGGLFTSIKFCLYVAESFLLRTGSIPCIIAGNEPSLLTADLRRRVDAPYFKRG